MTTTDNAMRDLFHIRALTMLLCLWTACPPARADLRYGPLSLSAFGTLGGAWSSNADADYTTGLLPTGPGRTYDFDVGLDSRVGAQLDFSLNESTTFTAQAVVNRDAFSDFMPRLTLGHVRHEFLDHFSFRAGRMQNPVFLASEYRLANFSNPWVRTPNVVYDQYPLIYQDGADLSYHHDTSLGLVTLRTGYGWFDFRAPVTRGPGTCDYEVGKGHIRNLHFVTAQLENGPWRIKAGAVRGYSTYHDPVLDGTLAMLRRLDSSAAHRMEFDDKPGMQYSLGAAYEGDDWLLMGEWGISGYAGALNNHHGGYLTAGYHFGRLMPQLTVGYSAAWGQDVRSRNPVAQSIVSGLYAGTNQDQVLIAAGLNYSVTDSMMLRGQLDIIQPDHHSNGPYTMNQTTGYNFRNPDTHYLFSVSLDFVY